MTKETLQERLQREAVEKLGNKMAKYFWSDCLDPNNGELLLEYIDNTDNFDVIPKNSKGYVSEISIGMLRDIVNETIKQTVSHAISETLKEAVRVIEEQRITDPDIADHPFNEIRNEQIDDAITAVEGLGK